MYLFLEFILFTFVNRSESIIIKNILLSWNLILRVLPLMLPDFYEVTVYTCMHFSKPYNQCMSTNRNQFCKSLSVH